MERDDSQSDWIDKEPTELSPEEIAKRLGDEAVEGIRLLPNNPDRAFEDTKEIELGQIKKARESIWPREDNLRR